MSISRSRERQDSRSASSAIKGCGSSAAEAIVAARDKDGPFSDLFDFCERVDPAVVQPRDDRNADQGRRVRLLRRPARAAHGRARPGHADRRGRCWPIARAARRGCSATPTTTTPAASRPPALPDIARVGRTRASSPSRRKCSASTSPAIRSPSTSDTLGTYCSHTTADDRRRCRTATEVLLGGMLVGDQVLAHQEPAAGQTNTSTPCGTWKTSTASSAASSGPSSSPNYGQLVQPDAILVVRGAIDRRPAARKRT